MAPWKCPPCKWVSRVHADSWELRWRALPFSSPGKGYSAFWGPPSPQRVLLCCIFRSLFVRYSCDLIMRGCPLRWGAILFVRCLTGAWEETRAGWIPLLDCQSREAPDLGHLPAALTWLPPSSQRPDCPSTPASGRLLLEPQLSPLLGGFVLCLPDRVERGRSSTSAILGQLSVFLKTAQLLCLS